MKKTLAAVAVLGAFASSAFAADVTLYGRLDTGLLMDDWTSTDYLGAETEGTDWGMESGNTTGSRIGVKGSEEISDGLTVGFVLETAISGDTGAAFDGGFTRESTLWVKTNYGTVWAGRISSIWSDGGSNGFPASAIGPPICRFHYSGAASGHYVIFVFRLYIEAIRPLLQAARQLFGGGVVFRHFHRHLGFFKRFFGALCRMVPF